MIRLLIASVALCVVSAGFGVCAPINGTLSVETPCSADRVSDKSSMVLGSLSTRLGKWTLTGSAQYNIGNLGALRSECLSEDTVRGTVAYALGRDVSIYSYYENRYSLGQERVVAGMTWRFKVGK